MFVSLSGFGYLSLQQLLPSQLDHFSSQKVPSLLVPILVHSYNFASRKNPM